MCLSNEAAAIKLAERDNLVGELVEGIKSARNWMNGDKWRFSPDQKERDCWQRQVDELDALIAKAQEQ